MIGTGSWYKFADEDAYKWYDPTEFDVGLPTSETPSVPATVAEASVEGVPGAKSTPAPAPESKTELSHKMFCGTTPTNDFKYGLSRFTLETYMVDGTKIELVGLLTEMPEFSFDLNYEDGPGVDFQDIFSKFLGNDLVSLFNTIGSLNDDSQSSNLANQHKYVSLLKVGTWTKKVYNGYAPSTIPLKFRIYTEDTCGQSSYYNWIDGLRRYASLSNSNEFSFRTALSNIYGAILNANRSGNAVGGTIQNAADAYLREAPEAQPQPGTQPDSGQTRYQKIFDQYMRVKRFLSRYAYAANSSSYTGRLDIETQPYSTLIGSDMYIVLTTTITNENTHIVMPVGSDPLPHAQYLRYHKKVGKLDNTDPDDSGNNYLKFEDIEAGIDNLYQFANSTDRDHDMTEYIGRKDEFIQKLRDAYNGVEQTETSTEELGKLAPFLKDVINDTVDTAIVGKYGSKRVEEDMNKQNMFGEKLWYLNIYNNTIFKKPLTVYISNWSFRHSDEMANEGQPVYYDFEITCALDQIYSRDTWKDLLYQPETKKGK